MLVATEHSTVPPEFAAGVLPGQRPLAHARVLHVINGEHYSGAERVQDLLAQYLGPCGFDVGFASLKPGKFATLRRSQAAPLVDLPMRSRFDLKPARQIAQLVRSENYSIIHTHTPRAALVGRVAAALSGVPLVHHLHSPTANDSTRGWQNFCNARMERYAVRGASAIIAVSTSLAEYALKQNFRVPIQVVPNGVPTRGPLSHCVTPSGVWTLGTVALFRPRKGLEVLLESLALLRSQDVPVRLRAVGEFETAAYQQAILDQVCRLRIGNFVDWVGFSDDVPAELWQMDLFVLPSLFGEGLSMVILEAMASGVPLVATRVEGVTDAVRDGIDGLVVPPGDSIALAAEIRRYVTGDVDWSKIRRSAQARQAEHFSAESMAAGTAEVYREVLGP
jgi:glycosyltransferase involved in cell wall biosynthesis